MRNRPLRLTCNTLIGGWCLLGIANVTCGPLVYRNTSPSLPLGLYLRVPAGWSSLIVFPPPAHVATLAIERRYLRPRQMLLKSIAARAGQTVCSDGTSVYIDGAMVALVQATDRQGRAVEAWQGCHTLEADEVFPLSTHRGASFDGRYVRWITLRDVQAYVVPLVTW